MCSSTSTNDLPVSLKSEIGVKINLNKPFYAPKREKLKFNI